MSELPAQSSANKLRPRAHENYKLWPGLENPQANGPIRVARDLWEERHERHRWLRFFHIVAYRSLRWVRSAQRGVAEELTSSPRRTAIEVLLGLPIALLTVDPYREQVLKWHFAWDVILLLVLANFCYGIGRRIWERRENGARIAQASTFLQLVIECARPHTKEGAEGIEPSQEHLRQTIAVFLQALADLTREMLQAPTDVRIHANLMIPMAVIVEKDDVPKHGLGIVAYSLKRPAEPAWTRLVAGDFGAGEALTTGKVCVVEDTGDPTWIGIFQGVRSKCFASFPVLQGSGKVVAVVNIDATRPCVLTRRNAGEDLYQAFVGPLSLLADILYNTRITASAERKRR